MRKKFLLSKFLVLLILITGSVGVASAQTVAKIGDDTYSTFADAAAAAQDGSEIVLLANIEGDITVPANVTLNGNDFAISGAITADGTITFAGVTKATNFGVKYVNTVVNIPAGASLQLTGTGRMVIGHGCTFNITGTIADAKTANVAELTPSLIMPGASFTGAGVTFNVTNAYISAPSSYCSSSSSASETFDFNITNSIWESAGKLAFESQSTAATVNFDLVESVLNTGSHLVFGVSRGEIVIDNSLVNQGTSRQIENRSTMTIKNSSVVNGAVATSSNAINPGTIIVENATYAVTGEFSGAAEGTGTLIIKNGANVSVGSIKAGANVVVDAEGMAAGDEINFTADLSQFTGTLSVINNDNLEASIVDGKVVLAAKPAAKIGEQGYATLAAAYEAAVNGDVIVLNESVTTFPVITKAVTFKGGKENAAVEINYALSQNFTAIDGIVRFENLTFNKPLFTEHGGNKPGLSIEFEGCNFNVNSEAGYGILIGTSWSNSVVKGLKVNNCNFKYVGTEFKGGYMLYVQCVNEVTITNNTIDGNNLYRGAIHLGDATEHATVATVSNNTIKNFCRGVMMGNRVVGSSATISGNTFDNINYSDKDSKPAQECAPIFIHSIATAEALQIALTNNEVENCANPMIYSEDTDLIKDYVTEFTGNTVDGAAVELANSYNAPNQIFPVATINDAEYFTLQAALDAAVDGDVVTLLADNAENVTVTQKPDVKFTIDGADKTMTGTITIDGKSAAYPTAGLTIKNVKFDANNIAKDASINLGGNNSIRYTNGVTVDNCTFTGTGKAKVAVKNYTGGCKNVTITNCTATGLHSLAQLKTSTTVTLTNNTVSECKNGVSLGSSTGVTVTECVINVEGYGIRPDGGSSVDVTGSEISAFIPVVVRNATNNASLTFNGTNTFTATNTDGLWCAIGTDEYETNGQLPTAPTGNVTVTLNGTGLSMDGVYGEHFALNGEGTAESPYLINNLYELKGFRDQVNAGNNYAGKYIKLTADIDLNNEEWTPIGDNTTIGNNTNQFKGYFDGNEKTISNLKVTGNTRYKGFFGYIKGTGMSATTTPSVKDLTLDGVNVNVEGDGYYVGGLAGQAYTCNITNVTVKGNVSGVRYVGGLVGHVYTYFKDCHFIGNASCSFDALGGIAGAGDCRAYDCSVIGDITGSNWVGGIVGNGQEGTSAVGCYVKGDVKTATNWYFGVGGIAGVAGHGYSSSEFKNNYFDGEVYLKGVKVPAMIIGIVNAENNGTINATIEGNSWNTTYYDAETPVYVTAESPQDGTTEDWIARASEELTDERNNNLVMLESDLQYVTEEDYVIMSFSEVTEEQVEQALINNAVAKIGETTYTTLQKALDAAVAGTGNVTVEIIKDINLTGIDWNPVTVSDPGYPSVTVNGNDYTITGLNDMLFAGTWAGGSGLIINDLTIANSNIVNDKDDAKGNIGVGAFIGFPQASETITLNNCHLVNSTVEGGHWTGGLIGYAAGYAGTDGPVFMNLTITDCSVTGSTITGKGSVGGIIGHGSGNAWTNVVIEKTTVSGNTITSTGTSNVKAGAVMGTIGAAGQPTTVNGVTHTGGMSVSATVADNTVKSNGTEITTIYGRQGTLTGMLELNGGSYDKYPIEEGVTYAAPAEGYEIVENTNGTYGVEKSAVAMIGDVEYKYLQAAFDAAQNDATIMMIADVTVAEEVIIDNTEKAVTLDMNGKTWNGAIKPSNAKLTIKNGTINNENASISAIEINAGELNLNNVNIASARHAVRIDGDVEAIIDGGEYTLNATSGTRHAVNVSGGAEVTIEAGTFVGPYGTTMDSGSAVCVQSGATVTINGGDFSGGKNATLGVSGTMIVKGGTFDQNPSDYVPTGYTTQILDNGKYEVLYAIASIGTKYYANLHEAMVAAKSGETVKLVNDVDLAGTEWEPVSFKGIFDGQYHTISNLTINKPGVSSTGFITSLNGTFKNVTFTNPTVTGGENTAVVAGRAGGGAALAENITINGTIKVETTHSGYARAGGIVGGWAYGNYKNITVDGGDKATSYIKHTGGGDGRYVAGIVGHADDVESYTNCTVKNITISGGWLCGGIAGPGPADGLATGCSVENIDMGADYSGGMFGWYYGDGTVKDATVKNVTFTDGSTNNGIIGGYSQNTSANVENLTYENVQNSNGAPLLDHVASIGNNHYFTFEAALDAVQNSETKTITLLNRKGSEISKEIDFTEEITFTITGNAPNYALPIITFQNATVNIENANFQIPELDARQNATINVINSTIVDAGGNSIVKSYYNGAINIDANSTVYAMQVTTMGYITVAGTLNATWQTNVYGNGLITLNEGATFKTAALHLTGQDYSGRDNTDANRVGKPAEIVVDGANFTVGKVLSAGGADYSYNSSKGINVGTVEGKSAILNIKNGGNVNIYMANGETANIGAGGTVNIAASTLNTICRAENGTATLANNGTVYVTGAANLDANVTGNGWFYMNGVTLDADTKLLGAKVRFASGTSNIDGSTINDGFFQVGIGAYNGVDANVDTENGVVVNVTNAVVGANGETYAGWAGTGFYDTDAEKAAAMTNAKYVLNIENSIAEFGYLHVSNDGELNVKGDAAEKKWYNNSDYSFYAGEVIINGTATFDATDVLAFYTKVSCDNGTDNPGTLNIVNGTEYEAERHNGAVAGLNFDIRKTGIVNVAEGADLHVGEPASIAADATMNIGGTATVLGELTNNGTINFTNDAATLATTTEGLTINYDLNPDKKVVYVDGVYKVVEKVYVAKIGDVKFESLQEAIEAVAEGETVKLMADVTITEAAHGQNALNHARAINFTLDLNGKTLSANTGNSVFRFNISGSGATDDVTVTIKNGTVVSGANTWCTLMSSGISADVRAVMNLEDLVIENYKGGDFAVKAWANGVVNAEGVTINSTYGGGFYALGGEITLENCTVNQEGLWTAPYNSMAVGVSNGGKMTVNSGTYSAVPLAATDGNNQGTSHGSWTGGVMSSGGTLIINGGTFSNGNIGGTDATNPRELFIVGADADYGDNVNGQVIINGGTFTSIGAFIHCETIWGSANDSANDYMPTMGVTITAGDFTAVAGKTIGGCDPVSTGNPVDVEISGGTYGANHAIDDSYLVAGYEVAKIDENVYEVRIASFEKFYTAAGVETTSDDAAYSLSFTVTDYANNKVSVKIGSKIPVPNSNINLVTPSEVQFEDLTFNVTSVANSAFNGTHFKKVTISEGVETIGNKALYFMSKLTELVLPSTLVSVGEQCIGAYNPTSVPLKSIVCYAAVAPSAFEPTSNASFQTCVEQQTMLIVPNAADYTVYSNANGWKFTNILGIGSTKEIAGKDDKYTLLATVTSMNPMECSIKIGNTKPAANSNAELVIPETVTFFEGYDFNVTSIPNNAFKGCNNFVGDLVIPATVKTIGYMAFNASHNSNAGALIFAENCELKTIDAWAFNAPFEGDFQLPTSLTSVGVSAFSNNGEGATLTITAGNKGYGRAFSGSKFNKLVVKEGVESLPGLAFYNTRFTEVELPSTLTNIAEGAFDDNTSIRTITSNNPVPPTVQVSSNYIAFEQEVFDNATLFVPDHAAKALYEEAYVWKEFAISTPIIEQTTQLNAGWNWFAAYVDIDLESLQNALGENATIIKNHTTGKWTKYEEGEWYGTLETISPKEMYIINTSNTIELTLVGELVELTPITIKNNWNAIGYMLNEPMSVESALNSIVPVHGDYIKSRDQYAAYDEIDGWYGTLETLIPGEGYMLKSNYSEDRLLTYSYPTRNSNSEVKDNITTDGNYWTPNHSQYPNNMTMTAMVEVEGGDYEVAAFVDGEVRGSARPIYVEALDAHILFLTIHGDEIEEMTFRYYDIATGEEFELNDRINYSNDAIIGSLTEPYIFNRGTTGIGEASLSDINIYPNPTTTGTEINLQATCDTVEVFNALGIKVAEYHNVDSIDAIETAGIYVIRITNGGNVKHCSLVVK